MPRKRPSTPAIDTIEQNFLMAIQRLLAGTPDNKALQKKARAGKLKLDKRAVAVEAGHSRTTLYKYPKVIAEIERHAAAPEATSHGIIEKLRADNAELRRQRDQACDRSAAMVRKMDHLIRTAERQHAAAARLAARQAKRPDPHIVVGTTPIDDKVVSLPKGSDD